MYLVYDQNDVALLAYILDKPLHAAFELASELGARHQGGEIQQIDLLVLELIGHIAHGYALGQALGYGGLAHAGLSNEAGVIFLAAVQNLDHPLQFFLPAYHAVQLALPGSGSQVYTIAVQEFSLGRFAVLPGFRAAGLGIAAGGAFTLGGRAAEEAAEEGEGGSFAVVLGAVVPLRDREYLLRAGEGGAHIPGEGIQLIVADAHLVYHIVNGLYVQFSCALEAQALVLGLASFYLCYKNHGHVLAAAGTHCRLHLLPPFII